MNAIFMPKHIKWAMGAGAGSVALLCLSAYSAIAVAGTVFPNAPLAVGTTAPANVLIDMSVETPMGGAAYADQAGNPTGCTGRTTQGGGEVGACYFSALEYKGIFDPNKCYTYSSAQFNPDSAATGHSCSGKWSGNFLNWATMTAADMFVWTMTGGDRDVDTAAETALRRTRVTNNSSWFPIKYLAAAGGATPYTGAIYITNHDGDGYNFKVGTTRGGSEKGPPFYAKVRVCDKDKGLESNCKAYTKETTGATVYKPEGLIQRNSKTMRFGVFAYTTDDSQSRDGGVLRAPLGYVGEKSLDATGNLLDNPVKEVDPETGILVRNPLSSSTGSSPYYSGVINYLNRFHRDGYKSHDPVSELFYEAIRYFKHIGRTPEYADGAPTGNFPVYTNWNDPIQFFCQNNFMVAINDANPWLDKRLPGTFFTTAPKTTCTGSGRNKTCTTVNVCDKAGVTGMPSTFLADDCGQPSNADTEINVKSLTNDVGQMEGITPTTWTQNDGTGADSVGYVYGVANNAGSCSGGKYVSNLGEVMGTCPSPGKENSYYVAGLAYYANKTDLRPSLTGKQNVSTFMIDTQEYSSNPLNGKKNMLYLAGKYGGFKDANENQKPDLVGEWDTDADGQPDNYVLASQPEKLIQGLERAFNQILARTGSASNVSVNSIQLTTSSAVFQGVFNSGDWSGDVYAYRVSSTGVSATPLWRASSQIPAPAARHISIGKDCTSLTTAQCAAVPNSGDFVWTALTTNQKAQLSNELVVDYLRGDRSGETARGGSWRNRGSALGDIVDSSLAFEPDTNRLFAGANDGMLHAFDASSGVEQWAFIPNMLVSKLKDLASLSYAHEYYVDGEISVSPKTLTPNKNILFAALGRGGNGFILMDVTNATTPVLLGEIADASFGQILGRATWIETPAGPAVMFPGGYNNGGGSSSGQLHLVFVHGSTYEVRTVALPAGANTSDNVLGSPFPFDNSGDGKVDTVYAGDLLGNVWKFDLSSTDPGEWKVASSGSPMFVAKAESGNRQPITAPVTVFKNDDIGTVNYGATYVFFGSGSFVTSDDPGESQVQTWYGLIDDGSSLCSQPQCGWRAADILKERTFQESGTLADGTPTRTFAGAQADDMLHKRGWFIDLDYPSAQGERIVTASRLYKLVEPVLLASSIIPKKDPCVPGGLGYLNAVNPYTGARLTNALFDLAGNGTFAENIGSVGFSSMPGEPVVIMDQSSAIGVVGLSSGSVSGIGLNRGGATASTGRVFWREILTQ